MGDTKTKTKVFGGTQSEFRINVDFVKQLNKVLGDRDIGRLLKFRVSTTIPVGTYEISKLIETKNNNRYIDTTVHFNSGIDNYVHLPVDCTGLFEGLLYSNLDMSRFDWGRVTSTSFMFYKSVLKNIKIDGINLENTANVLMATRMFAQCNRVKTIDLSNFNLLNVRSIAGMFSGDINLVDIKMPDIEYKYLEESNDLLDSCLNLENINLGNFKFDNENVTGIHKFFKLYFLSNSIVGHLDIKETGYKISLLEELSYKVYKAIKDNLEDGKLFEMDIEISVLEDKGFENIFNKALLLGINGEFISDRLVIHIDKRNNKLNIYIKDGYLDKGYDYHKYIDSIVGYLINTKNRTLSQKMSQLCWNYEHYGDLKYGR